MHITTRNNCTPVDNNISGKFYLDFNLQNASTTCHCTLEIIAIAMQRVANATQQGLISSQRRASRSRVPGENCIDNISIAWMAAVNLFPSYDTHGEKGNPSISGCEASHETHALSRWINLLRRQWKFLLLRNIFIFFEL